MTRFNTTTRAGYSYRTDEAFAMQESPALGAFRFESLNPNTTVTITVSSRLYRYSPRRLTLTDNVSGLDLTGME